MVIIESVEEFSNLCEITKDKVIFAIPLLTDIHSHSAYSKTCVVSIYVGDDHYIIPFFHNDAVNLPYDLHSNFWNLQCHTIVTPDKKKWKNIFGGTSIIEDINSREYVLTGHVTLEEKFYTPIMRKMYSMYYNQKDINKAIPLMDLIKYFEDYHRHMKEWWLNLNITSSIHSHHAWEFLNNIVLPTLHIIEDVGLCVNPTIFEKQFPTKAKRNIKTYHSGQKTFPIVYTEYHPYSITGRITNSFDGINYAALRTKDDTRKSFVSRYDTGMMVSIDYMSFHPLIIADTIDYTFSEPVYQYLAKQYFNVIEPTAEDIRNAKLHTMKLFYDEAQPTNIEFIQKMYDYRASLWEEIQANGKIYSPYGKELKLSSIDNPTPGKLLSYVIQTREMEISMKAIADVCILLDKYKWQGIGTRLVLYTYDSILLDYCKDDGPQLLRDIVDVLEQNGKFPVKIEAGKSFGELQNITNLVKNVTLEIS